MVEMLSGKVKQNTRYVNVIFLMYTRVKCPLILYVLLMMSLMYDAATVPAALKKTTFVLKLSSINQWPRFSPYSDG